MKREIIYSISSPYRDEFRIHSFTFGTGEKSVAIVGAMRGDEIQQQYICARLVNELEELENAGHIIAGHKITVIPSCNPFSMNVSRRFWTMDGTDINRMFPGYDQGETTQRIAAAVFNYLNGYKFGIQMASFYMPGNFVPHVRMLKTGYEDVARARLFGLPYVSVREPLPFDTTLLNYNWQIWETSAYSVYAGQTNYVEHRSSQSTIEAILRFMYRIGVINRKPLNNGYESTLIDEANLINIKSQVAGIFYKVAEAGYTVHKGDILAKVIDPYIGTVINEIKSPVYGKVFFAHNKPLVLQSAVIFRIHTPETQTIEEEDSI